MVLKKTKRERWQKLFKKLAPNGLRVYLVAI